MNRRDYDKDHPSRGHLSCSSLSWFISIDCKTENFLQSCVFQEVTSSERRFCSVFTDFIFLAFSSTFSARVATTPTSPREFVTSFLFPADLDFLIFILFVAYDGVYRFLFGRTEGRRLIIVAEIIGRFPAVGNSQRICPG